MNEKGRCLLRHKTVPQATSFSDRELHQGPFPPEQSFMDVEAPGPHKQNPPLEP